jgi:divalent metal cation (Fe/Co/Zn/Cd) transporter
VTTAASDRRAVLQRRVRLLVAATITYNVVEAVIALVAGTIASSIALIGFGLDSVIEVSSAAAVAWQFAARSADRIEHRERTALRVIAWSFFALAAYVVLESLRSLLAIGLGVDFGLGADGGPQDSPVGLALVAVSVAVMPALSLVQRRTGRELGSASAVADSKQTLLCTYLSIAVLVGQVLNAALGWWWADPAAGVVLAALAVREGRNALRGDTCCAPAHPSGLAAHDQSHDPDNRRPLNLLSDIAPAENTGCDCAAGCTAPCCTGKASR